MFENIEQLEREVQEFRKNILASSELVASFERMIAQIKKQSQVLDSISGELQATIKLQTEELQKQIATSVQKQADLIAEQSRNFEDASRVMNDAIAAQIAEVSAQGQKNMDAFGRSSTTLREQIRLMKTSVTQQVETQKEVFTDATRELATVLEQKTDALGARTDATLAEQVDRLTAANQAQIRNALDAIAETNREFAAKCDEVSKFFVSIQEQLKTQKEVFTDATRELATVLEQKTDALGARTDAALAEQVDRLTAANQAQIRNALDAMAETNREFAAKCDEVSKFFVSIQEQLNARYEQVLSKLEAANVSETVRLSKAIIKSMNAKFGILLTGIVAAIALAVLAYIK